MKVKSAVGFATFELCLDVCHSFSPSLTLPHAYARHVSRLNRALYYAYMNVISSHFFFSCLRDTRTFSSSASRKFSLVHFLSDVFSHYVPASLVMLSFFSLHLKVIPHIVIYKSDFCYFRRRFGCDFEV